MVSIIGNLVRVLVGGVVGFLSGFFASETDILEADEENGGFRPTWLILGFVFVGYLIFREFNK